MLATEYNRGEDGSQVAANGDRRRTAVNDDVACSHWRCGETAWKIGGGKVMKSGAFAEVTAQKRDHKARRSVGKSAACRRFELQIAPGTEAIITK